MFAYFLFLLLVVEVACVAVLLLPAAIAAKDVMRHARIWQQQRREHFRHSLSVLTIFFVYVALEATRLQTQIEDSNIKQLAMATDLYRAQRNSLLSGICVLLALIIDRMAALMLEDPSTPLPPPPPPPPLPQQQSPLGERASAPLTAAEEELAHERAQCAALRERVATLLKERESANKSVEALKRQAQGLSDEYARLLTHKQTLEDKLSDYELLWGDTMKKAR